MTRVLYVCPFAHYTGHQSWAVEKETEALKNNGADVTILTYDGIQHNRQLFHNVLRVTKMGWYDVWLLGFIKMLRNNRITQRIAMFLETHVTLQTAITFQEHASIDSIHLRDGEPFPFLSQLLAYRKKTVPWVVTLTGTNLLEYMPLSQLWYKKPSEFLYVLMLKAVNSKLWKRYFVNNKNKFVYVVQNEKVKEKFENYMDGVLRDKVYNLSACIVDEKCDITKQQARDELGLPQDKVILLSFGSFHVGKDIDTILKAIKDLDVVLLHAGHSGLNTDENNIEKLVDKYDVRDKVVIHNYYIPEDRKALFFRAADAVVLSYKANFQSTTSVLWEACRYNVPVIASNSGELEEIMAKYNMGLGFVSQNVDSLIYAIQILMMISGVETDAFKEGLHKYATEYSSDKWGKRCLDLHREMINCKI